MQKPKPIETIYNGYCFRSRLKARWAVFFDELGIEYEYEKEGYKLRSRWYLPDFYFHKEEWFGEVKPVAPTGKCPDLMREFDDNPPNGSMGLLFLIGLPEMPIYEGEGSWTGNTWHPLTSLDVDIWNTRLIQQAVDKARQARFEHGDVIVKKCHFDMV
jgi:hypothetical protein